MKKLPDIPNFPQFRSVADADKAFRALLIYLDLLKKSIEPTLPAS